MKSIINHEFLNLLLHFLASCLNANDVVIAVAELYYFQ
jgi:hypothetical protein